MIATGRMTDIAKTADLELITRNFTINKKINTKSSKSANLMQKIFFRCLTILVLHLFCNFHFSCSFLFHKIENEINEK